MADASPHCDRPAAADVFPRPLPAVAGCDPDGVLWGGMFWMFADGFQFLQTTIGHWETYARAVGGMFNAFFAALMLMLAFSAGIILYASLFRSREIALLLTVPARTGRVFLHKFQEAIILSSWGFALLTSPMLVAYGIVAVRRGTTMRFCRPSWRPSFTFPWPSGRSFACGSCIAFPTIVRWR